MMAIQKWALRVAVSLCLFAACSVEASSQPGIVVAWGPYYDGSAWVPMPVPLDLTNVVAISGGSFQSLALNADGTVEAWGEYFNGLTYVPVTVPAALTNVVAIAAGGNHCLALKSDRTVVAWGDNSLGQTNVPAGLTNVVAIASGGFQSLALRADGTVKAWGEFLNGSAYAPVTVPAGLTNVVAIAAGDDHCLALQSNGTVVAWGMYFSGTAWVPMTVPAGLSNVVAIGAGSYSGLALKSNRTVVGWGAYYDGSAYRPATNVPAGLTNVMAIAAGGFQSLALKADKNVAAWGAYYSGSTWASATVPAALSNVVAVAAGYYHSLAITLEPLVVGLPVAVVSMALGAATNLNVSVWSETPYACQWSLNGSPIAGATSTTLALSSFDVPQAGAYSVLVSNQYDHATAASIVRLTNSPIILVDDLVQGGGSVDRTNTTRVTLSTTFGADAQIYYTLDGSEPDLGAIGYQGAFTLTNSALIRAIAYHAQFTDWAEAAPVMVNLWPIYPLAATTSGGGSITPSPLPFSGPNLFVSNTVVTLTATTNAGWSFLGWTGDSTATTNVTTVLMDRARAVQAVFGTPLSMFMIGNGQVLLDTPSDYYPYGSTVRLTAQPAAGYYLFAWAGAATNFANPLSLTVTNPTPEITALFGELKQDQVSLTLLPNAGGAISNSWPTNVYTKGEPITLTALPAAHYVFTGWGGDASGTTNPLALTLDTSKVITANFIIPIPTNPPAFTQQPLPRTLSAGSDTTLSFQIKGDSPFSYQWRLNGSPLPGATDSTLALKHVTASQAGRYDVVVIGAAGTNTSAAASVALFGLEFVPSEAGVLPLLILDCAPGTRYRLESSGEMPSTNWNLLAPVTLEDTQLYYFDESAAGLGHRFYRAVPQ